MSKVQVQVTPIYNKYVSDIFIIQEGVLDMDVVNAQAEGSSAGERQRTISDKAAGYTVGTNHSVIQPTNEELHNLY